MLKIKETLEGTAKNVFSGEEIGYLQLVNRYKDWFAKTDEEKQLHRKSYLKMMTIHFEEDPDLEYFKQIVLVTDKILLFLKQVKSTYNETLPPLASDEYFFRICSMLLCEKECIFFLEGIKGTRVHIPYEIFEPLLENIKDSEAYMKFELSDLFKEYRKMLRLFPSDPFGQSHK